MSCPDCYCSTQTFTNQQDVQPQEKFVFFVFFSPRTLFQPLTSTHPRPLTHTLIPNSHPHSHPHPHTHTHTPTFAHTHSHLLRYNQSMGFTLYSNTFPRFSRDVEIDVRDVRDRAQVNERNQAHTCLIVLTHAYAPTHPHSLAHPHHTSHTQHTHTPKDVEGVEQRHRADQRKLSKSLCTNRWKGWNR